MNLAEVNFPVAISNSFRWACHICSLRKKGRLYLKLWREEIRHMGSCFSSASLKNQASLERKECEEDIQVCVERGDDGLSPDEKRRTASLYSHQGNKGLNQDAAILCKGYGTEEGLFCGVFDGHGTSGHIVSRVARDSLPALLLGERNALLLAQEDDEFTDGNDTSSTDGEEVLDEWKEACINAFTTMDEELKVRPNLDCSFSGTTAVSIIKQGEDLIIANLGDSRAVMGTASEEGHLEAIQLTTDLKPSVPQEAERIRKSKGRVFALEREPHIQRVWLPDEDFPGLAMARALGDFQLKNYGIISVPQVAHRRVTSRDLFIVLATDGVRSLITDFFYPWWSQLDGRLRVLKVWDALSNEEVVSIVWSTETNEDASKTLVEAARNAWKSKFPTAKVDDCTAACLSSILAQQLTEPPKFEAPLVLPSLFVPNASKMIRSSILPMMMMHMMQEILVACIILWANESSCIGETNLRDSTNMRKFRNFHFQTKLRRLEQ